MRLSDLVLSCILLRAACGYELEITRKESLRHRLIKAGKWSEFLATARHNVTGVHLAKTLTQTVTGDFVTRLSIGTPPQFFTVVMSLSTPWLWVPDKTLSDNTKDNCPAYCKDKVWCASLCEKSCCTPSQKGGLTTFDSFRSSTYKKQSGDWMFGIDLIANDEDEVFNVEGFVGSDTVRIGNGSSQIVLQSLQFGQANDLTLDETLLPGDGAFGLGFLEHAQYKLHCGDRNCNAMTPTVVAAAQQKAIDQSVFTVWIEKGVNDSSEVGGVVTLGAIDTKRCNAVDAYHPTVEWWPLNDDWGDSWIVQVDAVRVGAKFTRSAKQWTANIELSYPSLKVPSEAYEGIVRGVGGYFDPEFETPVIKCDAKNIPPIRLVIGGKEYAHPVEPLVLPLAPDGTVCELNIFTDGSGDDDDHTWTLNAAFAQAYCLVCDFGKKRIGFATPKNN